MHHHRWVGVRSAVWNWGRLCAARWCRCVGVLIQNRKKNAVQVSCVYASHICSSVRPSVRLSLSLSLPPCVLCSSVFTSQNIHHCRVVHQGCLDPDGKVSLVLICLTYSCCRGRRSMHYYGTLYFNADCIYFIVCTYMIFFPMKNLARFSKKIEKQNSAILVVLCLHPA